MGEKFPTPTRDPKEELNDALWSLKSTMKVSEKKDQYEKVKDTIESRHNLPHNYENLSRIVYSAYRELSILDEMLSDEEKKDDDYILLKELYNRVCDELDAPDLTGRPITPYNDK